MQYTVFTCTDGKQYSLKKSLSKLRESYMYDLRRCENIYIPIHDLRNQWYLALIDLKKRDYQIWDSNPPRRKDDPMPLNQVRKLMQSLDIILGDDIVVAFPTTLSFTTFTILDVKAPSQPNDYDCGLLLYMFMDNNCLTPLQMESFQSLCQRLLLARFLALFPSNNNILSLKKNAQEHYNKLVSNNEVVPPLKIRATPIQKLRARCHQNSKEDIGDRRRSRSKYPRKAYRLIITEGGPSGMLNDKEAMQIAQKVDAIEIVPNHEIMAQEQASNLFENIPEGETHGNHSKGLAAATVEPCFQIPTIQVTIDHEKEIEKFQILNHAINASDQFGNNPIINIGNMVNNSTINPEKDFVSNQVIDYTT
ncbi:hypothetical protein Q3G72_004251 [Acer saccharum]|nr:hypothetical protein Q3G72_004251 [Acer saccharum]